jgi:hypothetical protein
MRPGERERERLLICYAKVEPGALGHVDDHPELATVFAPDATQAAEAMQVLRRRSPQPVA